MYAAYFGLSREPFSLAPDPRFLFMSERHREALAHLLYGVRGGGGFVLLTGEIGAGKTTVTRCFLEQLPQHCDVAYIFNPCLSALELLQTVCREFGIPPLAPKASVRDHVEALNAFLLAAHAEGRHALLVIDEAQALEPAVLEQLRLLTNLETSDRKLLQIMLIGQPELRDMLAQPGMEQLAQRVVARYHLGPLTPDETRQYVLHRLQVAGPGTAVPFDKRALARLHQIAGGVPRRINLLADRALLGAYGRRSRQVDAGMVNKAAQEVFDPRGRVARRRRDRLIGAGLLGLTVVGVAAAVWGWLRAVEDPAAARIATVASAAPAAASAAPALAASAPPVLVADVPAPPPALPPASDDPAPLLTAALPDEATAWRELALRWNIAIGEGDPCVVAQRAQMACYRSPTGGLQALRALARPAVLTLRGEGDRKRHAVLVALDDTRATLQVGRERFDLSLPALAVVWRGEFATFWRTPPGWRNAPDAEPSAPLRDWVDQRLRGGAAASAPRGTLRERVLAFQTSQGLLPDGRIGPVTLMVLNRSTGVDEPRLAAPVAR